MIKEIVKDPIELSIPCMTATLGLTDQAVKDLIDTVRDHPGCQGLAANQIGYKERIILVKINDSFIPMVNPIVKVKRAAGILSRYEGCLSFPGVSIRRRRFKRISVSYYNPLNQLFVDETLYKGLEARIIQHEVDHLDGLTIC